MTVLVNQAVDRDAVARPAGDALAFHRALPGYAVTPVRPLPAVAGALGLAGVVVKDESDRLGLPSFKVLGASWAVERALAARPATRTLVAASAGNHGRAVAHVARRRGLACRIFLPARSIAARRAAIAAEGAEVVVVDGLYEDAVACAQRAGRAPGALVVADVGDDGPARWVIDGYATLFAEAAAQAAHDVVVVPVGVGALAAAAARHAAAAGIRVVGVEPLTAACLTASLRDGRPTPVATPGTTMAGLDCAEVSPAAWPDLRAGVDVAVTVTDGQAGAAVRELARAGLDIGESGAAPLAGLRVLAGERPDLLGPGARVLLVATEGPTRRSP